jgi:hypothetical protein
MLGSCFYDTSLSVQTVSHIHYHYFKMHACVCVWLQQTLSLFCQVVDLMRTWVSRSECDFRVSLVSSIPSPHFLSYVFCPKSLRTQRANSRTTAPQRKFRKLKKACYLTRNLFLPHFHMNTFYCFHTWNSFSRLCQTHTVRVGLIVKVLLKHENIVKLL